MIYTSNGFLRALELNSLINLFLVSTLVATKGRKCNLLIRTICISNIRAFVIANVAMEAAHTNFLLES